MEFDGRLGEDFGRLGFEMEMVPSGKRRAVYVLAGQGALNAFLAIEAGACISGHRKR
jgi:hypothetical protein